MDKEKDRKQEIDLSMIPPINDLRMELAREEAKYEFRRALLNIAGALTVAACRYSGAVADEAADLASGKRKQHDADPGGWRDRDPPAD